jgi:hypothetical protein
MCPPKQDRAHTPMGRKTVLGLVKVESFVAKCCKWGNKAVHKWAWFFVCFWNCWKFLHARRMQKSKLYTTKFVNFAELYFPHFPTFLDRTLYVILRYPRIVQVLAKSWNYLFILLDALNQYFEVSKQLSVHELRTSNLFYISILYT